MPTMPTKIHACVDYFIALVSIFSPVLFGFGEGGIETLLPIMFGMLLILYSFFTNYELGLSKQIPLFLHFRMDQMAGALLAASPWFINFSETVYLPHMVLGIALVVSSLLAGNDIPMIVQAFRNRSWFRVPSSQ